MAKLKAVHNGSCQWCGAVQAVDPTSGLLAKHGYTVRWGFFSGVCRGADNLPFEKSTNLIERSIKEVSALAVQTRNAAAETRNRTADDSVYVRHYRPATWKDRTSGYVWAQVPACDLEIDKRTYDWGVSYDVRAVNPYTERKTDVLRGYICRSDADQRMWWQEANEPRAKAFEAEATKMDEYVAWQTQRVVGWAEKPLLERKTR